MSDGEQLGKPNDIPDLSKTHSIVDIPKFGKVFVITDIYEYYKTIESWHQQELERAVAEVLEALLEHSDTMTSEQGYDIGGEHVKIYHIENRIKDLTNKKEGK